MSTDNRFVNVMEDWHKGYSDPIMYEVQTKGIDNNNIIVYYMYIL